MRKTKIICTLGPSSEDPETIRRLILAGMNIARFNMSHGSHEDHARRMNVVRTVSKQLGMPVGILLDTKGPEVRLRNFKGGKAQVKDGQTFTFTVDECEGDSNRASCNFPDLYKDLVPNDIIMVNDGLCQFQVKEVKGHDIITRCLRGGTITDKKSMNFPNKILSMPFISEADRSDLLFGVEQKVDFIAASFVSDKMNVVEMRQLINHAGGKNIEIISKIENSHGIDNIDEIYSVCEGVMVARGDMGVEIPFTKLPGIQKAIVAKARVLGKRVIVATEMLESMINNPRPTRAETNDVSTAVRQGASAVMLSGETAAGKYPVQCVDTMSAIALETEKSMDYFQELKNQTFIINDMTSAICHAACNAALTLGVKCIMTFTSSGKTAKMISRFRPGMPIIACTSDPQTYTRLTLGWGLTPVMVGEYLKSEDLYEEATKIAKSRGCREGDTFIVTSGLPLHGETNIMKSITIK